MQDSLNNITSADYIKMNPANRLLVVGKMGAACQGNIAKSAAMLRSFYSRTNVYNLKIR